MQKMLPQSMERILWLFILSSLLFEASNAQLSKDRDKLLNWCLDSKYHKKKPGKEGKLYSQCIPWKENACCTEDTTVDLHHKKLYNFNFHHCEEETGHKMSDECLRHFRQDLCFYECEPNIGRWVTNDTKKMRNERFYKVPLCASDCDSWWRACHNDYTCIDNWSKKFKFNKDGNYCPQGTTCSTFKDVFKTAQYFCENVWDHSWKYTSDKEPCMRIWFNGTAGNPNRKVAEYYVDKLLNNANRAILSSHLLIMLLLFYYLII